MSALRRLLLRGLGIIVVLLAGTVAWLEFWPAPGEERRLTCTSVPASRCTEVGGRVVYALQKDRSDATRPLHLVLASRDSVAYPGVTIIKIPASMRPSKAPSFGTWVSAAGPVHRGSNGQDNVGVEDLWIAR